MKKKPYRPSILNGLKEQLEGQFQMSEGHVLEYKELKAQTNIEVPTHVKPKFINTPDPCGAVLWWLNTFFGFRNRGTIHSNYTDWNIQDNVEYNSECVHLKEECEMRWGWVNHE